MGIFKREGDEPLHAILVRSNTQTKSAEVVIMIEPPLLRHMLAGERECLSAPLAAPMLADLERLRIDGYTIELHVHIVPDLVEWSRSNLGTEDEVYERWENRPEFKRIQ